MLKSQQMRAALNALSKEAEVLMNKEGVTAAEIKAKSEEIAALKAKISMQEQLEAKEKEDLDAEMKKGAGNPQNKLLDGEEKENENEYGTVLYNSLAGKAITAEQKELLIKNALSSTSGTDGGYAIPVDQQTKIKELSRDLGSLDELVNIETVSTLTGSRNIEKDAEYTAFEELTEGGTIPDTDSPQIVNVPYSIKTYAGILPVPNNLLSDAKALQASLTKWIAKKSVATRNKLIVTLLNTLAKTPIATTTGITAINAVKSILNVILDPAISKKAKIVMNQDAFNKYDLLVDNDGRPLLTPMVTDPNKYLLAGKEIKVYSNKTLPTRSVTVGEVTTKYAPVIIGDLKEAITLFDREAISILATNIGAGAFETNTTKFRPIFRLDVKKVDTGSVVFGEIVVD